MLMDANILEVKYKADDSDPVSMYQMFEFLASGKGIKKDLESAVSYLIRLANLGADTCAVSRSGFFDRAKPTQFSNSTICAYDYILSLIGAFYRENSLPEIAAMWYKKALDFVDIEFYRWSSEEREHLKKGLWTYKFFHGVDGYEGVSQHFDELAYLFFKLDWERHHGMDALLKTFLEEAPTPSTVANLPTA